MKKKLFGKGLVILFLFLLMLTGIQLQTHASLTNTHTNEETQYWALLVAVGVYADNPEMNIPPMLEEVDDFYHTLLQSSSWSANHIKLIKGKDATVVNIIQGFRWLDRMDDNDDISLVYFATHGGQLKYDIPPRDEADGKDEVLSSYWEFAYPLTYILDDEINFFLNRLDSKGVCLIVDSCHAGGFNDTYSLIQSSRKNSLPSTEMNPHVLSPWSEGFAEDVRGKGRVILMCCREDELAYGDSYFISFLTDGLRGYADINTDGIVSAEELFSYAKTRVIDQEPTLYDDFVGELPLIIEQKRYPPQENIDYISVKKEKNQWPAVQSRLVGDTSQVCGYVTDTITGNPIYHAFIFLNGIDTQGNDYDRQTYTNIDGYYSTTVLPGSFNIFVNAVGYFWYQTDWYEIGDNGKVWVNISLQSYPPENSIVCGYVTDENTEIPIANAEVNLFWTDDEGHHLYNDTSTNTTGFYTAHVAAGYLSLDVEAKGYFDNKTTYYVVNENETIMINVSLEPRPPEHSIICGYITDAENGEPIKSAYISLNWLDGQGHHWRNHTDSDDTTGFYTLHSSAGEIYLYCQEGEYRAVRTYRNDVKENETLWANISLVKDTIQVDITKPLKAVYFMNKRIAPFPRAIIIGGIDIEAYVHDYWYSPRDATKVEFYVDGILKFTDATTPYSWSWHPLELIKHRHTIKVIAYDTDGSSGSDEIIV